MTAACSIDACCGEVLARGWCNKHYRRWYKYGDPSLVSNPAKVVLTESERFWSRIVEGEVDDCWLWPNPNKRGYGLFGLQNTGKTVYAHRYAWQDSRGPLEAGKVIDHMCRQRSCVNPAHLQQVSQGENLQNMSLTDPTTVSGHKNVYWHKATNLWFVCLKKDGIQYDAGYYKVLEDAVKAARALRMKHHTNNQEDWNY